MALAPSSCACTCSAQLPPKSRGLLAIPSCPVCKSRMGLCFNWLQRVLQPAVFLLCSRQFNLLLLLDSNQHCSHSSLFVALREVVELLSHSQLRSSVPAQLQFIRNISRQRSRHTCSSPGRLLLAPEVRDVSGGPSCAGIASCEIGSMMPCGCMQG